MELFMLFVAVISLFLPCFSASSSVIQVHCTDKVMSLTVKTDEEFRGIIYAGDPNRDCRLHGKGTRKHEMSLPLSQCGIVSGISKDEQPRLVYRVRLYIQHHPLLQQQSDERSVQECTISPTTDPGFTSADRNGDQVQVFHPGWMEVIRGGQIDGPKISKSVLVGEQITIVVRSKVKDNEDAIVTKCVASDGTSAEPELLIGDNGCPLDAAVVPAFTKTRDPADPRMLIHWTKFPAFKFPDRNRLYLSCQIVYCDNACQVPRCSSTTRQARQAVSPTDYRRPANVQNSADVINSINVVNSNLETANDPFALEEKSTDGKQCFPLRELMTAIGILAAILLIALLLALFFWWNRRQRKRQQADSSYGTGSQYQPGSNYYSMEQYPDSQQYYNGSRRTPQDRHYESHT